MRQFSIKEREGEMKKSLKNQSLMKDVVFHFLGRNWEFSRVIMSECQDRKLKVSKKETKKLNTI